MPVRALSKELQQIAEDELCEVPSRVEEDIKFIRDWLSMQSRIQVKSNDQWLLSFLRGTKFNYQKTKERLELLAKHKRHIPEFFGNRDPFCDEVQEMLKKGAFTLLPQTVNAGSPRILILRAGKCDPARISVWNIMKVLLMIIDILYLEDDHYAVSGIIGVVDLQDLPYKYLSQTTPNYMKKVIECGLYAYPTRAKHIYYINCPVFFPILFALIKLFVPEKIVQRLHVFKGLNDLFEFIPQSILPTDYGGTEKHFKELAAEMKLKVESYREWFVA